MGSVLAPTASCAVGRASGARVSAVLVADENPPLMPGPGSAFRLQPAEAKPISPPSATPTTPHHALARSAHDRAPALSLRARCPHDRGTRLRSDCAVQPLLRSYPIGPPLSVRRLALAAAGQSLFRL